MKRSGEKDAPKIRTVGSSPWTKVIYEVMFRRIVPAHLQLAHGGAPLLNESQHAAYYLAEWAGAGLGEGEARGKQLNSDIMTDYSLAAPKPTGLHKRSHRCCRCIRFLRWQRGCFPVSGAVMADKDARATWVINLFVVRCLVSTSVSRLPLRTVAYKKKTGSNSTPSSKEQER